MENPAITCSSSMQMEYLRSRSTDLGSSPITIAEASSYAEAGSEPASGVITPINETAGALPSKPLSTRRNEQEEISQDAPLSRKIITGISVVFFLSTIAFAVASGLVQLYKNRLTRSYSDILDPGCVDKLSDSGSPVIAQAFDLDLTFGNFTFTQAKIIDVAWDTAIGQGGRLLHGLILYRCVMRRLLIHAMEYYCVTYKYYLTISWSRASFESLCVILKDCFLMQGITPFLCTLLLIYALSYTLFFSLLWSTATGYLSLSHRLYAMPDGNVVPLNTPDLALCWVLDGGRFNSTDDHIELGPDFSALGSLTTPFQYAETKHCLNLSIESAYGPSFQVFRLVYTSGGWKTEGETTIWDHFGTVNGSNNIEQSSENFQSIRAYAITKQLLQISLDPRAWTTYGPEVALTTEVRQNGINFDWSAGTDGKCNLTSSRPSLRLSIDAAQVLSPQITPIPEDMQFSLEFDVPENMSKARFSLGDVSGESLRPGEMPYNSTLWLNGSAISFPAPFIDFGHGCSGNNIFGGLGNCICYKGNPISLDLLGEGRAICNTAPGYVWGFSGNLLRLGLAFEAAWMACCLICYLWLSIRGGLVSKKIMRSAGPMQFALEFSEAVCEIEQTAPEMSEDMLKARLKGINVGYRTPSVTGEHGGLRHRVVAGLERKQRLRYETDTDTRINLFEEAPVHENWRRREPTDLDGYEDLNWNIYEG